MTEEPAPPRDERRIAVVTFAVVAVSCAVALAAMIVSLVVGSAADP